MNTTANIVSDRTPATDSGVSTPRLWILRIMYAVLVLGIGVNTWPDIIQHEPTMPRMTGIAVVLIGTIGLFSVLGLRYPLQMLPIMLFELVWKVIWMVSFALPLWLDGSMDDATRQSLFEISVGLVLLFVIPWGYVVEHYIRKPAERARK